MSEQAKHTPGPYAVEYGRDKSIWIVKPGQRMPLAEIPETHGEGIATTWMGREEREANARLIAAAPDLLAACRPIATEIRERADVEHSSWNPDAHIELTLSVSECRAVLTAIAKAEGESR